MWDFVVARPRIVLNKIMLLHIVPYLFSNVVFSLYYIILTNSNHFERFADIGYIHTCVKITIVEIESSVYVESRAEVNCAFAANTYYKESSEVDDLNINDIYRHGTLSDKDI